MFDRRQAEGWLGNANARAWLRLIREGESSQDDDAYRTLYGGGRFESFAAHPRIFFPLPDGRRTSAAGAYQIVSTTWDGLVKVHGFTDFGPAAQDVAALLLTAGRGAIQSVLDGQWRRACELCRLEWSSLPSNSPGPGVLTWERAERTWNAWSAAALPERAAAPAPIVESRPAIVVEPPSPAPGVYRFPDAPDTGPLGIDFRPQEASAPPDGVNPQAAPPAPAGGPPRKPEKENPMLPVLSVAAKVVGAVLPDLIGAAPDLIRIFGSGGEVTDRNAKAAEKLAGVVRAVAGTESVEAGTAAIVADPVLAVKFREAVAASFAEMLGLVRELHAQDEASKAAAAERARTEDANGDLARYLSRSTVGLLGAMIGILAVIGIAQAIFADDHRPAGEIVGALVMLLGAFAKERSTQNDYRFGTSAGSAAKDALISRMGR